MKKHSLKGYTRISEGVEEKIVFLDGKQLDIARSRRIRTYSNTFDWGKNSQGALQLALAIVLEITGECKDFSALKKEVIQSLSGDFDIQFYLDNSVLRKKAMQSAHAINKYLTYQYMAARSNFELLCFVHPDSRTELAKEFGLIKS